MTDVKTAVVTPPPDIYARTVSGRMVSFVKPDPKTIAITDIANGLATESRFSGQTNWLEQGYAYCVAQHCVEVAQLVLASGVKNARSLALGALLHDGSEAFMRDIPGPLKTLLPDYCTIEDRVQAAIYAAFGLPAEWATALPATIHDADQTMVKREAAQLCCAEMMQDVSAKKSDATPAIAVLSPRAAYRAYLELYTALAPAAQ